MSSPTMPSYNEPYHTRGTRQSWLQTLTQLWPYISPDPRVKLSMQASEAIYMILTYFSHLRLVQKPDLRLV